MRVREALRFARPWLSLRGTDLDNAPLLLVEDETLIRLDLKEMLQERGFHVMDFGSAERALAQLADAGARFGALITDINLGRGLSGWDLARQVRECQPGLAVIYISANRSAEWSTQGVPDSTMLPKPFVPGDLFDALATLRSAPSAG